ncbi:MAG: protein kinase [Lentisphaeraceae bacterium]|nr:protein kinase [Lentisphaeraceae bacterium]
MKSIDNAVCIGQHIDERYELKKLLELRTNTNIYVAFDIYRQRPVLLRLFFWDFTYSVANPDDFLNIALSVSHLAQPEHLKIISCGKTHDGMLYTVWPYENIESVSKLLHVNGPFETGVALSICRDIASALENVYRQTGVGHYNLNTNKLYINSNGDVRLSDLGHAAYLLNDEQFSHEENDYFNERFLAPEITLDNCAPNIQSDMYSMGACLYTMITGKRPFDNLQFISPEDYEDLALPASLEARLGKDICKFIYKMLALNPKNRFDNWLDVLKALNHCLQLEFIVDTRSRKTSLTTIFTDGFILENLTCEKEDESDMEETQVLSADDVSYAVKATKPAPYIFPKQDNHLFRNLAVAAILSFSFTIFYLYSTNKDSFQQNSTSFVKATPEPVEIATPSHENKTERKTTLSSSTNSQKPQHKIIVKDLGLQKMKVKDFDNTPRQQFQELKFEIRDLTLKKDWEKALAMVNSYKGPYHLNVMS